MKTVSYPNYSDYISSGKKYNLDHWVKAMRDIYVKLHLGASRNDAVNSIIKDWDEMEKFEFLNWLKYYESGDYLKYKRAQHSYYVNDDINYFLPNPKSTIPSPIKSINDQILNAPQEAQTIVSQKPGELKKEDQRQIIEDQRKKLLGRLNSVEKLLSSHHGHIFAGPDFERLLIAIYELKKQIQTVNKISLSTQTVVDLIIRQANLLKQEGFHNASMFMTKFAQNTPGDFSFNLGEVPAGGSQPQGGGSLGNNTPNLSDTLPENNAIEEFIDNLQDYGLTTIKDINESEDDIVIDDDVLLDQEIVPEINELIVEAQAIEQPIPQPQKKPIPENLEVEAPPITPEEAKSVPDVASQAKSDFDVIIDSAFANLTINDVIAKLEAINSIFRNREISRQLAIVDVMLDRLGLASFFSSLSEATSKNLEANNYCLTRIEDILSKLRGAVPTAKIDLQNETQKLSPEAENIRNSLQQEEQKEKQRKEVKRQLEEQKTLDQVKPEGQVENIQQELAQPVQIEQAPKPVAAPTV